jgi:hypothetical protein
MAWRRVRDDEPIPYQLTKKALAALNQACSACGGAGSGDRRNPCQVCGKS